MATQLRLDRTKCLQRLVDARTGEILADKDDVIGTQTAHDWLNERNQIVEQAGYPDLILSYDEMFKDGVTYPVPDDVWANLIADLEEWNSL